MKTKHILFITAIALLYLEFWVINYFVKNGYITECFTVNMPINTTYSCKNFCGPNGKCAITGVQCLADTDCSGCQTDENNPKPPKRNFIPGNNSDGKLTFNMTPQYSTLTSGYGTQKTIISKNIKPVQANFGTNNWRDSFNKIQSLFDNRYKIQQNTLYLPNYPARYTITGEFVTNDPLPANF